MDVDIFHNITSLPEVLNPCICYYKIYNGECKIIQEIEAMNSCSYNIEKIENFIGMDLKIMNENIRNHLKVPHKNVLVQLFENKIINENIKYIINVDALYSMYYHSTDNDEICVLKYKNICYIYKNKKENLTVPINAGICFRKKVGIDDNIYTISLCKINDIECYITMHTCFNGFTHMPVFVSSIKYKSKLFWNTEKWIAILLMVKILNAKHFYYIFTSRKYIIQKIIKRNIEDFVALERKHKFNIFFKIDNYDIVENNNVITNY